MVARIKSWLAPATSGHALQLGLLPGCWSFPHEHCSHPHDKNVSGVPTTLMLPLPGHSPPSLGDWSHRGDHPSLPAQCQNLHAAKSMEMCLKLRSGNLVGPWRDLVLSIPLLVPEKWFKVLWLPLYSASFAAQPPVPSWHQNSLWTFGHHRGWGWLCPCWCIHPHTVQELFPLNDTPSWRIFAPGVKVNPS